jgi:3-oxoacyl-(acyl-carrier-protein) synthase
VSDVFVNGIGAVTPAGWGVSPMRDVLAKGDPIPVTALSRPGEDRPLRVRAVPPPPSRPAFLGHARLRRTSPITQYAVAAALEALGDDQERVDDRMGVVFCALTGCVNYSRRFYDEALKDPATASPLVFPETVFNAPASHLTALLNTTAVSCTLVGDPGTFLQGLALAADWLITERVDACLVIGAEELDWLTAEAYRLFAKSIVLSAGAGALHLTRQPSKSGIALRCITEPQVFFDRITKLEAARRVRSDLRELGNGHLLCDGTQGITSVDAPEREAWSDWIGCRLSPKTILGEGLAAASAWQCVAAIDALRQNTSPSATVSVVGCNEQAIGAHFRRMN